MRLHERKNSWEAPPIEEALLMAMASLEPESKKKDEFFYIFRVKPYIDALCILFDAEHEPAACRRFTFHEDHAWDREDEGFFKETCLIEARCAWSGGALDSVFLWYNKTHPEWQLKRYRLKGLRLLDHIYHCMKKDTPQEILYKSGLDELAVHIDDLDELNLLAGTPSELYDDLSLKVLRSLNCVEGARLLRTKETRLFLKELNMKFPQSFAEKCNDAQCRYLRFLIEGDLSVGEAGRLFASRRDELSGIRNRTFLDLFMVKEKGDILKAKLLESFGTRDPIYLEYIREARDAAHDERLKQLDLLLNVKREEYDRAIRRANRKRDESWQERGFEYIVRYPQTINDFCREALYMRNCLLTYLEAMIKNDTTILFLRRADDVNRPFITIEVYKGELMQAYHRFNADCTPAEADWIRAYCRRHGIGADRFCFDSHLDELF
ncbi:MAG: PcfJ domain-containing protein [Lachnospiraceae bacterium]|nr:PcfJ domain-containing protein [Lachnospiraceae bacterium]